MKSSICGITASTTETSVDATEAETESTTAEDTSIEVTTSTVSTGTTSTGTTSTTDTVSTDTSTTEASTTDMSITTTTAQTTSDTTTFSSTTTAAAVPQCVDSNDCLLALNPLCVLGLCVCAEALCTPRPDISECMNPAQCSTGQFCQSGVCVNPVRCGSAGDCLANADTYSYFKTTFSDQSGQLESEGWIHTQRPKSDVKLDRFAL
ncbi:hypothetical protein FDECE_2724 [Fusarium decemcellulare]|nr:hypothetical protein FDECE_2724 [Fusarium decemcellulare]